jgi:hypothetical protein
MARPVRMTPPWRFLLCLVISSRRQRREPAVPELWCRGAPAARALVVTALEPVGLDCAHRRDCPAGDRPDGVPGDRAELLLTISRMGARIALRPAGDTS